MVLIEPEHGARQKECTHLATAVVEDITLPIRMEPLSRVSVFKKVRAVKVAQTMLVGGKVRRHPIENHANAMLMKLIDEVHEIPRRTVPGGGGEISRRLVSP